MEWSGPVYVVPPPAAPDVQGRLGAFAQQLRARHEAVAVLWQVPPACIAPGGIDSVGRDGSCCSRYMGALKQTLR
jgi:hypothetical protein